MRKSYMLRPMGLRPWGPQTRLETNYFHSPSPARRPSLDSPAGDLGEMGWLDRLGEQYPAPGSGGSGDE